MSEFSMYHHWAIVSDQVNMACYFGMIFSILEFREQSGLLPSDLRD